MLSERYGDPMNEADIRKYAHLMRELGLTGLEITENDKVVRLERNISVSKEDTPAAALSDSPKAPGAQTPDEDLAIRSPIVGVFYAAPAENADPFVSVGDSVKKGQVLCIVEAMKLMNEIVCEYDGVITEICVTNGQVVEYGTELFRIRR